MSDHLRDEAGITLIELLISIILLGIIIVPLTNAFIDGINSTTASQKRLSEARSPMFTNAYFAEDAQSSDAGEMKTAADTTTPTCGTSTVPPSPTWPSAPAATSAWGCTWPGSSCASR